MDFGTLLHVAKRNSQVDKAGMRCYSTKFEPPKKESKEKKLSANIQKFLAKKEQEEKERERIAKQKKEELLAMRDSKAKNKINKMLKVIKSANKSVLEDAVDHENTAVTLQGPDQPDEDDYGYVSQEASAYYKTLMDKYKSIPEDIKFGTSKSRAVSKDELRSTKDRVRAAIIRANENENMPHRRQRTSKSKGDLYDPELERQEEYEIEQKSKIKKSAAPPPPALDFQSLLKLAEKKQFEPIEIEPEVKTKKDLERPMTKKEKKEFEERQALMEAKIRRQKSDEYPNRTAAAASAIPSSSAKPNDNRIPKLRKRSGSPSQPKMQPNGRIPKLNSNSSATDVQPPPSLQKVETNGKIAIVKEIQNVPSKSSISSTSSVSVSKSNHSLPYKSSKSSIASSRKEMPKDIPPKSPTERQKLLIPPLSKSVASSSTKISVAGLSLTKNPSTSKPSSSSISLSSKSAVTRQQDKIKEAPAKEKMFLPKNINEIKPRQFPPPDVQKPRQLAPSDVQKSRSFPPSDVQRSKQPPSRDIQRKALKRPRIEDDDSEYDSEMDDFIDDGPEEGQNYSKYIQEIFGYDKSRYRNEDFDDRTMESNFAQQMREEYISKKIGIMEDLEDMRQEALEKMKKSKTKKKRID